MLTTVTLYGVPFGNDVGNLKVPFDGDREIVAAVVLQLQPAPFRPVTVPPIENSVVTQLT